MSYAAEWKVYISARAEKDLDQIYAYIAETLLEPGNAANQVARLRKAILGLDLFPEGFPLLRYEPWRSQGVRFLAVDNYLALFKAQKRTKTVSVITVVYAKRNLPEVL